MMHDMYKKIKKKTIEDKSEISMTFLAAGCAYFQSKRLLNISRLLLKEGYPEGALANFILSLEEISKMQIWGKLAFEKIKIRNKDDIKSLTIVDIYCHLSKLENIDDIVASLIEHTILQVTMELEGNDIYKMKLENFASDFRDGKLPRILNEMKKNAFYTDLKNGELFYPMKHLNEENIAFFEVWLSIYEYFIKVLDKILGIFAKHLIDSIETFHKASYSKQNEFEIIQMLKRVWPAIRFIIDSKYIDLYGLSIDQDKSHLDVYKIWVEKKASEEDFIQRITSLHEKYIKGDLEIPAEYF